MSIQSDKIKFDILKFVSIYFILFIYLFILFLSYSDTSKPSDITNLTASTCKRSLNAYLQSLAGSLW